MIVLNSYVITVLTLMVAWSIVALGLNIISGLAGQFHLGIGVYMGTGAYMSAMLTTVAGFSFWEALVPSVVAAGVAGLLTGLPALRVRDDSLVVFTIGIVFVFESLLVYLPYFGGPRGISKIPSATFAGQELNGGGYLVLALAALALAIGVCWYVKRTWFGLALESIREDEHATTVIGIYPSRFKLYAFLVGGGLAGLGGVIYTHLMRFITPYDFGFIPSVFVLVMLVLGGLGTIRGAVFGACFLTALPELIQSVHEYRNLVFGVILVLLMLYEPHGLLGDGSFVWRNIVRWTAKMRSIRAPSRIVS